MIVYRTVIFDRASGIEKNYIQKKIRDYNELSPEPLLFEAYYDPAIGLYTVRISEEINRETSSVLEDWEYKRSLDWVEGNYQWSISCGPFSL